MVDAVNMRGDTGILPRAPGREVILIVVAIAAQGTAFLLDDPVLRLVCHAIAAGLALALVVSAALGLVARERRRRERRYLATLIARDPVPGVLADAAGHICCANAAAGEIVATGIGASVDGWLADVFAAPGASVGDLMRQATRAGTARADRISRTGQLRVTVTQVACGDFLWRKETLSSADVAAGIGEIDLPALVARDTGEILGCNAAASALLGDRAPGDGLERLLRAPAIATGAVATVQGRHGPVSMRLHVVDNAAGDAREIYLLPVDIAGISSASDFFDMLPVPMLKVRTDGTIIAANGAASDLLGRSVPAGTALAQVLSGLGRSLTDWLRDAVAGHGLSRSEFLQVRSVAGDRFVQVSLKPIEDDGEPAAIAILTDATELKTLEAQFVQSQKMQAIGQLAGGVAHDFNNLLTAISGHCDLLLLRHDEGDPAYADLVQIGQNANRAAALVEQLLAFSRKQTLRPQSVDLGDVLSDLTHLLSRLVGETVRLSLRSVDPAPRLRVDKRQLEQVIMNLVVNARDAMPQGGEIVVEADTVTLTAEVRRNRAVIPPGDYATIRVSDQGVGIPPENLQKIFEPFYTTKKTGEGTGLGLSTAYGIVKQTGGFIFADSTPGSGSVFTLYFPLPLEETAEPAPPPAESAEHPAPEGGVILLVEDEAPVRAFASRALRLRGLTVIEAETGEDALEKLDDGTLHVDVFVTDVVMPGIDGPTWVRRALRARPDTRVVFVSGYAEEALTDEGDSIPHSVFLPKPFSLQELTNAVQRELARALAPPE